MSPRKFRDLVAETKLRRDEAAPPPRAAPISGPPMSVARHQILHDMLDAPPVLPPPETDWRAIARELLEEIDRRGDALAEPSPDEWRGIVLGASDMVTRFEVIDHRGGGVGRAFTALDCRVVLSYQDHGLTLKVFVDDPPP